MTNLGNLILYFIKYYHSNTIKIVENFYKYIVIFHNKNCTFVV